ncbi:MAG: gliding motility protein GldM [Paludibacteraceae bacterium]|nr:gliding motility protein GldM [Paludibacteraceae bacterium]
MMYLVLTAMLALNVSADILNGFNMVARSLQDAINSSKEQTNSLMDAFEASDAEKHEKFGANLAKAREVQAKSEDLFNYIQDFRAGMIKLADGDDYDQDLLKIVNEADVNAPGNYGLRQKAEGEDGTRADALQRHISDYRDYIVNIVGDADPALVNRFNVMFSTESGKDASGEVIPWTQSMFEYMPMAAVNALLTRYQNDIISSQNDLIKFLYGDVGKADLAVNAVQAIVIPNSRSVMQGGQYSAQIFMAAYDSTARPIVMIDGKEIQNGRYEFTASGIGTHSYSGTLQIPGEDSIYHFTSDYFVTEPSATISNTDLNVVYLGIENHFSVSVPGVTDDSKVSVTAAGGSITKTGKGKYIVKVTQGEKLVINVSADVEGRRVNMGSQEYRIKKLPDPRAYVIANGEQKYEGSLTRGQLKNISLYAGYDKDELLDAKFTITEFTLVTSKSPARTTTGSKLSAQQQADLEKLKMGDLIIVRGIKAKGPDGIVRTLKGAIQLDMK